MGTQHAAEHRQQLKAEVVWSVVQAMACCAHMHHVALAFLKQQRSQRSTVPAAFTRETHQLIAQPATTTPHGFRHTRATPCNHSHDM